MLIYLDDKNKIQAWNESLTQEEAAQHIQDVGWTEDQAKWIEQERMVLPEEPLKKNQRYQPYYADGQIEFKVVTEVIPPMLATADDLKNLQLAQMEGIATLYEQQEADKLNQYEVLATILEQTMPQEV